MTLNNNTDQQDALKSSYYVNKDFYARLIAGQKEWDDGESVDITIRSEVERLILREARLLDEAKLKEWMHLFTEDCLYWVPAIPGGGDPRIEVSIAFDDRRRLEDRVYRLRTGYAWSQVPASRTIRVIGNLEVWKDQEDSMVRARSNFMISEFRAGRHKILSGWYGYRLRKVDGNWNIVLKQINLVDCDQAHENLTLLL